MYDGPVVNPRRPVFITTGRHPFEVGPLLACALVGTILALSDGRPPSMTRLLPEPWLTAWLLALSVGGAVGLVGAYWRGDIDDSLLIEFAGLSLVATMCALYVAVLFAANPSSVITAGGLLAGITGGAGVRCGQIIRDWLRIRRARSVVISTDLPLLADEKREEDL